MLPQPEIVERDAAAYVAVTEKVTIPFGAVVDPLLGEVAAWLGDQGVRNFGPAVFRYNVVDMPRLDMEFGFLVPEPLPANARVRVKTLPAGRYATLSHIGPYDNLIAATAHLIGWARDKGLVWDAHDTPEGQNFASRFELYPNGPMDEPDPQKWETQIFFKLRE